MKYQSVFAKKLIACSCVWFCLFFLGEIKICSADLCLCFCLYFYLCFCLYFYLCFCLYLSIGKSRSKRSANSFSFFFFPISVVFWLNRRKKEKFFWDFLRFEEIFTLWLTHSLSLSFESLQFTFKISLTV